MTRLRGITQMVSRLLRPNLLGALHKHAGNDLEAVGDAMLELLKQDLLFAQQIVPELFTDAGRGDVDNGNDQPDLKRIVMIDPSRIDHQPTVDPAGAFKVKFIGADLGQSGGSCPQEGK
jgi:hypothetical protein